MTGGTVDWGSGTWTGSSHPWRIWRPFKKSDACDEAGEDGYTCMSGNTHLDKEYLKVVLDACTASDVYVDVAATIPGTGTLVHPFHTVGEGTAEVCEGGNVLITSGTYLEKLALAKRMTLKNAGGAVVIRGI